MTVESSNGKSYFLKSLAGNRPKRTAAVFTDVMPGRRSFAEAVQFLLEQLKAMKVLRNISGMPSDRLLLLPWLQAHLSGIRTMKKITLILNCVDNIRDWNKIAGSLFQLRLPSNVTFS